MTHILHTADWQIGRQYGHLIPVTPPCWPRPATTPWPGSPNWRPSAAWTRCWWPATFDTQGISDRGIRRLFGALGAYAGPWVMIAGNHDAALADSVWTRAIQLGCVPANVCMPLRAGVVDLPGANLAVLAAPLTQRHTYDDVTQAFDLMESEAGRVRVGLAHGSVTGRLPETIDATNPIAADQLRARGWTIWRWATGTAACGWTSAAGMRARPSRIASGAMSRAMCWTCASLARARCRRSSAWPCRYRWSAWRETLSLPTDAQALADRSTAARRGRAEVELAGHVGITRLGAAATGGGRGRAGARAAL